MAPGFWAKVGNFFKKVGTGIVKGLRKVKEIGARVMKKAMPVIQNIPIIGTAVKMVEPGIDYVAQHGGRSMLSPIGKLIDKGLGLKDPAEEQEEE